MHTPSIPRVATLTAALSILLVAAPASAQAPADKTPAAQPGTPNKQAAPKQTPPNQAAPAPKQGAPDQAKPPGDGQPNATPPGDGTKPPGDGAAPDQGTGNATPPEAPFDPNRQPTAEDLELARQSFVEGNQLFQAKDYDQAVEKFKLAYRLSRNALLLYNIGFTHDMRKDRELALFYYEKFLTDAGPTARMYDEVRERVEAIKKAKEADAFFDSGSMGKVEEENEGETPRITQFMHQVVEETPPGYPLDITAFIPEASGWQVTLFYRASGEGRFGSTLMKERYNELVGRIPASKTTGPSLQYYIEVRDKQGSIVARSGRSASPNLVFVEEEAKPRYYPDVESEELDVKPIIVPEEDPDDGRVDLGFTVLGKSQFKVAKWSTTAAAAAFLLGGLGANRRAIVFSDAMVEQAARSRTDICPTGTPCRSFAEYQKSLEKSGKRWEVISYVSTGLGVAAAGAAGYMWYKGLAKKKGKAGESAQPGGITMVPLVGQDFVGSAATLSF